MKSPHIVLINPKLENAKSFWIPLGIAYIAAYLEKHFFSVQAIDANALRINNEDVVDHIFEPPDIIGITAMTGTIYSAWLIAKTIKARYPKSKIVLGGHHPSVLPEESLEREFIDIVVIGEGEITMKEIAESFQSGFANISQISGIVFKTGSNMFKHNIVRRYIKNLDEIPFPAWHLFPFPEKYVPEAYRKTPTTIIFTSRGCPYRCTFCYSGVYGKTFRKRSPRNIIAEIKHLKEHYGIKEFQICDDNFILDAKRTHEFCELLDKEKINMPWASAGGMRVNTVVKHPALIMRMAKAGCYRTAIGIESGNQTIINNIKKDIDLEQVRKAVKILNNAKIIVGGFFMIGNYGENEETVKDTIDFAKSLSLDYAQFMIATPYPGSEFYEQVKKEGKILITSWKDFNLWTGAVFEWNSLSRKDIERLYRKAYISYYFNVRYLIKSLIKFKPSSWKIYLNGSWILLKNLLRYKTPMS